MATSRLVESERPQTRAVVKYVGRSAYKVRQVCDLIRGKDAEEAQNILLLCNRGAAEEVGKLLNSAMANASHNQNIPGEELFVKEIFADEGPTMKRFKPRARGRASSIRKRMSHVTIVLERKDDAAIEFKASKEQGTGAANAREQRRRRAEASKAKQAEKAAAAEAVENEEIVEGDVVEEAPKAKAAPKAKTTETEEKTPAKKPAAKKPAAKKTESQVAKDEQPREASGSASDSTMDTEKEGDK
jgi:large subunit ribosomal protein L22